MSAAEPGFLIHCWCTGCRFLPRSAYVRIIDSQWEFKKIFLGCGHAKNVQEQIHRENRMHLHLLSRMLMVCPVTNLATPAMLQRRAGLLVLGHF
mmetsp:Transcript_3526/g.8540  ORF Transcript_3526/g.8540 Transcript_3526/m.8540 type:complete len:94 (-) Transcript_3526:958-1239(-)